jgi:excisionase family DNA binding protein
VSEVPEVLDIREASQYLGISADSLYKYAMANKVPCFKIGSRWRFKKSVLDRWMDENSCVRTTKKTL